MVPRTLFVALLMLAVPVLTGCLGSGEDDDVEMSDEAEGELNTTAPDGRKLVAFEETNATEEGFDGVDHHHDYWQGRDRVLVFETAAEMAPIGSSNAQGYEAQATFRPPPPDPENPEPPMIFEATERVEFTITNPRRHACEGEFTLGGFLVCTSNLDKQHPAAPAIEPVADPAPPTGLKLRYKHAATTQWIDGGDIAWDTPFIIKITNPIQTDMPHATSSVWEFQVLSPNAYDSTLVFDAKAEIVRGDENIPMWPGHPDFYVESDSRKVLSADWGACDNGFGATACLLAGEQVGPIHPDRLVSYGTRTVFVWVNISEVQAPNPATAPSNWFLFHRNATGRDNTTNVFDEVNHPIDKLEHLWVLPVDDDGMDSPYADGSRWNFELGAALLTPVISCYSGCAEWSAKYTIDVITTNYSLSWGEYDWSCLRDDYCPADPGTDGDGGEYVDASYRHPDGRWETIRIRTN